MAFVPAFIKRAAEAARYTISGITPETWMSPLQPLEPKAPIVTGRVWDMPVGYNRNFVPRGKEKVTFKDLRLMARNCEIAATIIETRKDQLCSMGWNIKYKSEKKNKEGDKDGRIQSLEKFFRKPDQTHLWDSWLRMFVDEHLVIDAVSIWKRPNRVGSIYGYELLDGTTIFPLMDESGRRPLPPDPAFQQILKGVPKVDYTSDELLYMPKNKKVYSPYGCSPIEQIITTCRMEIERGNLQLAYFTEGATPDSYAVMGKDYTPEAIRAFDDMFNGYFAGNAAARRHVPFFPFNTDVKQLKPPPLKDEFDEWIARKVCYALSVSPTPFIKQMNRATADSEKDRAIEEGNGPTMLFIKAFIDQRIQEDFGYDDLEFEWEVQREQDPAEAADIDDKLARAGIKSINEIRADRGLDPIEGGDVPMLATATGYVPVSPSERIALTQQAQAAQQETDNAGQTEAPDDNATASKAGYSSLRKGKQHLSALPFPRPTTLKAANALAEKLTPILQKTGVSVAKQFKAAVSKVNKDTQSPPSDGGKWVKDFVAALSLDDLETIIDATPDELAAIMAESGKQTLAQVGADVSSDLVNVVFQDAADYARQRAAELVGKKWVDGELVENPNAIWRIDETTRDAIRTVISDGLESNIGTKAIAEQIMDAGAFSAERAMIIAKTEIAKANSMGTLLGFSKAAELGIDIQKEWKCDAEACPVCSLNADDGPVDLEEEFVSGDLCPPAHPNCECVLQPVINEES